ncbi:hypothetical protein [Chitinophaga sp. RAB17]|uniref:hypothetical protein n=1 Tax=Chitinophaga sp. RAB17 TaxID=3233049 RepID=UPI003F8F320E
MKYSIILWLFGCWSLSATAQQTPPPKSIHDQLAAIQKIMAQAAQDSSAASIAAIKLLPQLNPDNVLLTTPGNDNSINAYLDGFFRLRSIAGTATAFDSGLTMRLKYVLYNVQSDRVRWAYYQQVVARSITENTDNETIGNVKEDLALMVPPKQRIKYDSLLNIWNSLRQGQPIPALALSDDNGGRLDLAAPGHQMWVIQTYAPNDTASMQAYRSFCSLAQRFAGDSTYTFVGLNLQGGPAPASPLKQYHLTAKELVAFRRLYALSGNTRTMVIRNGYFQMATMPAVPEEGLVMLLKLSLNMHYPVAQHEE